MVKTSDHFPSGYVREGSHLIFHGGTIFWDAETGIIWIENRVFLGSGDTVMSGFCFVLKNRYVIKILQKPHTLTVIF